MTPQPGDLAETLAFGPVQRCEPLPGGVWLFEGVNPQLAAKVSAETGDPIAWPFATFGWLDEDNRGLAVVMHGLTADGRRTDLSFMSTDLPLRRSMLDAIADLAFRTARVAEIRTSVPRSDLAARDALRRLGFRAGPVLLDGRDRVAMILAAVALPPAFRRSRRRRAV